MTLELYTELKEPIELRVEKYGNILNSFPKNEIGLVVNKNIEYLEAKKSFDLAFNELRTLNKHTPNKIKKEYSKNKRINKILKNQKLL